MKSGNFVSQKSENTLKAVLAWILIAGAAYFILQFYFVAFQRLFYPYDLEWMEGGAVDHVIRVMHGKPLYVEPTIDFVPYIYTPFSYYVSAGLGILVGEGYVASRLVSIVSISIVFFLLYRFVKKETQEPYLAIIAVGVFASTYDLVLNWFDIGRVDSLFLCLLVASVYALYYARKLKHFIVSAILIYLAFMTKQSAILVFPALVLIAMKKDWRKGLWFAGIALAFGLTTNILYDYYTEGWFSYYIWYVGTGHEWLSEMYWDFWKEDLWKGFKYPFIISLVAVAVLFKSPFKWKHFFAILMAGSFLGMSYFGRLHSGGDKNVLIPVYFAVSVIAGLSVIWLKRQNQNPWYLLLFIVACMGVSREFIRQRHKPSKYVPTKEDVVIGDALIDRIKLVDGPVLVASHGYYSYKAGKPAFAHFMGVIDVLRSHSGKTGHELQSTVLNRINQRYFDMIIMDNAFFMAEVQQHYDCIDTLKYENERAFMPPSGVQIRPRFIFVPKTGK